MARRRLTDSMVIAARRHVRVARHGILRALADEYDVSVSALSRAIAGETHRHIDRVEAPAHARGRPTLLESEVRGAAALIRGGRTITSVAREQGIARSTLRRLIRHLEGAA